MPCDDLDTFVDGELPADDAQTFRDHLAYCAGCQRALRGRMLEAVVMGHGDDGCICPRGPRGFLIPFPSRRKAQWVMLTAGVALAAAIVLVLAMRPDVPATQVAQVDKVQLAPERRVEVRFSEPLFDEHRPLLVMRAVAQSRSEAIGFATLVGFEQRGQLNAIVAARALGGDVQAAIESAKKLPATARSLSDRAALELLAVTGQDSIPRPRQEQAADLAISLTSDALRMDPSCVQAMWNKAIALKLLELPLEAARVFDDIARRGERGWSEEARGNARDLESRYEAEREDMKRLGAQISEMISGGSPVTPERAKHAPSATRYALYQAIATASTTARLDALLPVAETLDAAFATTALVPLVKQLRGSDLARRAPVAESLRAFVVNRRPLAELDTIRARALQLGLGDIALASLLFIPDSKIGEANAAALTRLAGTHSDPWWRVLEIQRRTHFLQYIQRDTAAVEAAARSAAPLCRELPNLMQCARIALVAGAANADMGRLDTALKQLAAARKIARQPSAWDEEARVLHVIAQVMSTRVQDAIDSAAIADAYFGEYASRWRGADPCLPRLQGLDFVALAALDRHRYQQAAEFRSRADALEIGECSTSLRLNGEEVRLHLLLEGIGTVAALRHKLSIIEQWDTREQVASYVAFLNAAAIALTDRTEGAAALHKVIADVDADPTRPLATEARSNAYGMLIENAAAAGEAESVMALLARRLGIRSPERCSVAIAQWHRAVVAVRGARGEAAVEARDVPAGALMIPPAQLISRQLQDRLAGCPRVEVLASGPYFGMANILGPSTAWVYKNTSATPSNRIAENRELVVTDIKPPDDLNLPQLRSFQGSDSAVVLRSADATPTATLENMKKAGLIVIVAHGVTDAREPAAASLILSPDRDGEYLLTAAKVRSAQLASAPIVILAGCDAGRVQVAQEPWSLATSFLAAGARAVIAPTEQIPDEEAGKAFASLVARIRGGANAVDALHAERMAHGPGAAWLSSIVVFE
jgi:hypothetical protein